LFISTDHKCEQLNFKGFYWFFLVNQFDFWEMWNMNEEKNDWRMKLDWMKLEMADRHQNCVAVTLV
jgi:hypothetical protein